MLLIDQSFEILAMDDLALIERAGRTCYKSEDRITPTSADRFVKGLISRDHGAMLEHGKATVHFITDRAVTHELVRHRIFSFGQESQRYVNYQKKGVVFIRPVDTDMPLGEHTGSSILHLNGCRANELFLLNCVNEEQNYLALIEEGWLPQRARRVLSNATKTEITVTGNYRQWRHLMQLRAIGTTGAPDPQIQQLMLPLLKQFYERCPAMFEDLYEQAFGGTKNG